MAEQKKKKKYRGSGNSEDWQIDNRGQERWTRCSIQGSVLEEEGLENGIVLWVQVEALSSACVVSWALSEPHEAG